ncbi:1,8-cineole synthase, chloroplast precursor [Dorcoceras hygrometricum]|uniref:1,8-cineole synthase, chloroplast n=1 Tax=Dorcoceras hygrometricum TaxID=472368 RepID=A0A2Z7C6V4_9LAMI|nr:1,8-cineole synthase, chloroplast precursor [Dorcoceras hygrometricum]
MKRSTIGIEELTEKARKELQILNYIEPVRGMILIDNLQWLGIGYHFEDEINLWLDKLSEWDCGEDDLHATALRFRLLRQQLRPTSCGSVFENILEDHKKRKSKPSLNQVEGLLNLYEASYLGASGEEILSEAMKFAETQLASLVNGTCGTADGNLYRRISLALELPRHHRMVRLESRRHIEDCSTHIHCSPSMHLVELAKLDYNRVQLLHKMELEEFRRWWRQLGLVGELSFARDPEAECFFWVVGCFPDPRHSGVRMEMAKTIAILITIDDVFDKHGTIDELLLFTHAVQRWDVDAIENLPDYMKICYMALYKTTTEIAQKILKQHGIDVLHFLSRAWIDTIEAYMIEAKWFQNGQIPSVEDYIENGTTTGGSYMALVHAFFLMGEGITNHNMQLMRKPYPKLFSTSGRILRLWDDLGTSKEEQDFGDNSSLIPVLMKEKNLSSEDEARRCIKQFIRQSWGELNTNLLESNIWPLSLINVCFNMCRTSEAIYHHQESSYLSSFKRTAKIKLLEPITN